jgi:hypothetical protein
MKLLPNVKLLYLAKISERNKEFPKWSICEKSNIGQMEEVRRIKESKDPGENTEDDLSSDTSLIPLPFPIFPMTKLAG